ncbi:Mce family protein [Rhodococcus sp. (in: high G+C Gram-positive bacteria)]|uniref:Mce family protein n=1 Tax=Rhodococcus sp. TaxID=1831 RepID=UPI00257AC948|nr:Mce family protein [Rhodococcus sp. (in: high G+C Gram-positive bacteria)]MBQ9055206.1 Mce family protein [Rhodococcus sp. (in: high G+C Gram-positive bacteria)]
MSRSSSQDFLRGVPGRQNRVLNSAGLAVVAVAVAVFVNAVWFYPHFREPDGMSISIEVPFVGPGVRAGTKVILRGGEIGEVTGLDRTGMDSVRLDLALDSGQISGLTDEFDIDFRAQNYFGSTAVNLVGGVGGTPLAGGQTFDRTPIGDFTMSTMIEKGSLTVDGTLTDSMISTLNKVIRYTDGLTPLIDSGLLFADRIAQTQQEMPSELLSYFNNVLDTLPAFNRQAVDALTYIYYSKFNLLPDGSIGVDDVFMDEADQGLALAATQLFGQAGTLLASHGEELTPLMDIIQSLTDTVPYLLDGGATPSKLREVVARLDATFSDAPEGKQLNLRIVLDDMPALAAPLALAGLPDTGPKGAGE